MANCPNCNAPLEDDARFCANCGTAIPPADPAPAPPAPEAVSDTIFCPNCGEQTSAAFEYCEHCGAALNAPSVREEKKSGGSGMKKWMMLGGIVVVAAALVIVLISIFSGGGGGKGYGLYIKEGEVYYSNLSKNGAWQLTSKLSENAGNSSLFYATSKIATWTFMSKDGKTLFFPDKLDSSFTLYYRSVSGKKEAVKVDSDITRYAVNDNASLVTYLKNGTLYQYSVSRGEKEKLDGDVWIFYVSDDGKKVVYIDDDDTLYQIASGKEKEKLDSDVNDIPSISDDCKTMIYQKDDTLYLKRDGKEKEKIASDVSRTFYGYKNGELYYVTEDDGDYTLCYFDGKKSTELMDEYAGEVNYSMETPMMVYRDDDEAYWLAAGEKTTELDAEEPSMFVFSSDGKSVWYVDEPDDGEGELYHVPVSNGTAKKAEKVDDDVNAYSLAYISGHLVYFKDLSNNEGELYVDEKKADDDVSLYGMQMSESGALLYVTDYNSNREEGTLKQYSGGKSVKIEDDVYAAAYMPNGSILYLTDYSTSKYRGDLYVYNGKSTKLDEDVVTIIPILDGKYRSYR